VLLVVLVVLLLLVGRLLVGRLLVGRLLAVGWRSAGGRLAVGWRLAGGRLAVGWGGRLLVGRQASCCIDWHRFSGHSAKRPMLDTPQPALAGGSRAPRVVFLSTHKCCFFFFFYLLLYVNSVQLDTAKNMV